jgi:hypothetical protein
MNRRAFLAAIAGLTLDPERLLWRPGAKLISIPKPVMVDREPFVTVFERWQKEQEHRFVRLQYVAGELVSRDIWPSPPFVLVPHSDELEGFKFASKVAIYPRLAEKSTW